MNKITRDFISQEQREYKFRLGNTIASALTGFIAGTIAAVIVFLTFIRFFVE